MDRVTLTKEQARWYSNAVFTTLQALEASDAVNPGVKERRTHKTLLSMKPGAEQIQAALHAFGDEPFEIDVYLNKKQREATYEMLTAIGAQLADQVLPRAQNLDKESFDFIKENTKKMNVLQGKFR